MSICIFPAPPFKRDQKFVNKVLRALALFEEKILGPCEASDGGFDGAMRRLVEHKVDCNVYIGVEVDPRCTYRWKCKVDEEIKQIFPNGCGGDVLDELLYRLECPLNQTGIAILKEAQNRNDHLRRFLITLRDKLKVIGSHPNVDQFYPNNARTEAFNINRYICAHAGIRYPIYSE